MTPIMLRTPLLALGIGLAASCGGSSTTTRIDDTGDVGDTGDTDQLWEVAAQLPHLGAVFIETSFPDDMLELARISKHLTPALMAKQLRKLGRSDVPVYVYHMKPRFESRIREEVQNLGIPRLSILEEGQEVVLM